MSGLQVRSLHLPPAFAEMLQKEGEHKEKYWVGATARPDFFARRLSYWAFIKTTISETAFLPPSCRKWSSVNILELTTLIYSGFSYHWNLEVLVQAPKTESMRLFL